jgi:hypothetical protein
VPDKVWGENFHKAGKDDEINRSFFQMRLEGGFGFSPVAVIDEGKRKLVAAGERSKLRMISCYENRFGGEATRFPRTEDSLSRMCLFGYEDGKALAGSRGIGKAKGEFHAKLLCEREELGANLLPFKF